MEGLTVGNKKQHSQENNRFHPGRIEVKHLHETEITRVDAKTGKSGKMRDLVAEEKPLYVFINKSWYATIFCSPSDLREMVVGHLLSEGILGSVEEIEELKLSVNEATCRVELRPDVSIEKRHIFSRLSSRVIRSTCGSPSPYQFSRRLTKVKSSLAVRAQTISECVNRLNSSAEVYRKTGGVHVAALYDEEGKCRALAEDVGRHNAVDKAIGIGILNNVALGTCFLALSGRLTGDIVYKAARVSLPVVVSMAAALDSGIRVAEDTNVTLVGFARGNRMNIYTSSERILVDQSILMT
jgi:FdhD protein